MHPFTIISISYRVADMRMSCNGCRVLRKGCSDDCSIRPCLEWIKTPDSQANATVFLAKFYGRAGLMNLINAGPQHIRPAIFKSLLYESCGRIVNPIFGSVGLVWSGNWQLCQNAVDAVLKGDPITQIATGPPLKAGDIRHVNKDNRTLDGPTDLRRFRTRRRFRRSRPKAKRSRVWAGPVEEEATRSPSHESSLSQHSEMAEPVAERFGSAERAGVEPNLNSDIEIELDLTLGSEPIKSCAKPKPKPKPSRAVGEGAFWKIELGLDYSGF